MSDYQPLPPITAMPQMLQAAEARDEYQALINAASNNYQISNLARAEAIDAAWQAIAQLLPQLGQALVDTYRTRLLELTQVIPIGPNVPAGSTPAEEATLHAAFRLTLGQAREASRDDLRPMYDDAVRFGDDNLLRAVLTVASDAGYGEVLSRWTATQSPTVQAQLEELRKIRDFFGGVTTDNLLAVQAFKIPEQPEESTQLPLIRQQAQQDQALARQTGLLRRRP